MQVMTQGDLRPMIEADPDVEWNVRTSSFCSLVQAIHWIVSGIRPIPDEYEHKLGRPTQVPDTPEYHRAEDKLKILATEGKIRIRGYKARQLRLDGRNRISFCDAGGETREDIPADAFYRRMPGQGVIPAPTKFNYSMNAVQAFGGGEHSFATERLQFFDCSPEFRDGGRFPDGTIVENGETTEVDGALWLDCRISTEELFAAFPRPGAVFSPLSTGSAVPIAAMTVVPAVPETGPGRVSEAELRAFILECKGLSPPPSKVSLEKLAEDRFSGRRVSRKLLRGLHTELIGDLQRGRRAGDVKPKSAN